jgi:hypothetical protein
MPAAWTAPIDIAAPDKGRLRVTTDLALAGIAVETPDGLLAASGLNGRLRLDYPGQGARQTTDVDFEARGGEAAVPALLRQVAGVAGARAGTGATRGRRRVAPAAAALAGSRRAGSARRGVLDAHAAPEQMQLRLSLAQPRPRARPLSERLPRARRLRRPRAQRRRERHLAHRRRRAGEPRRRLVEVNAVDPKARFTLAGFGGELRWNAGADGRQAPCTGRAQRCSASAWARRRFDFASSNRELRLAKPAAIDALSGKLRLEALRWQAPHGDAGARFQFGLGVDELDLASLSQALGWPPFTGTISGRIPSARFHDDRLDIDGGLQMSVFGGSVALSELAMERPFGSAPTLTGDVAIQDVDLEQITGSPGFGTITGGSTEQSGTCAWSPGRRWPSTPAWRPTASGRASGASASARSRTSPTSAAVRLAGGLQGKALGIFDDFATNASAWPANCATMSARWRSGFSRRRLYHRRRRGPAADPGGGLPAPGRLADAGRAPGGGHPGPGPGHQVGFSGHRTVGNTGESHAQVEVTVPARLGALALCRLRDHQRLLSRRGGAGSRRRVRRQGDRRRREEGRAGAGEAAAGEPAAALQPAVLRDQRCAGADVDITIRTPAIQAIQARMAERFQNSLEAHFDSGALGFGSDGLVPCATPPRWR